MYQTIENLSSDWCKSAQSVALDIKVLKKEYRIVNGNKVIYMKTEIPENKITILEYYFSNSSGTTQLSVFIPSNILDKYKGEVFDFLNGLEYSAIIQGDEKWNFI